MGISGTPRSRRFWFAAVLVPLAVSAATGCEGEPEDGDGDENGGTSSSGAAGTGASGGTTGGTTGGTGTGGSAGAQGGSGSGATAGSGGSMPTGGTTSAGAGGAGASGGAAASGGTAGSGGSGTGGTAAGSAGTDSAGGSGAGTAGSGAAGGAGATGGVAPVISGGVRWIGRVDVADPAAQKFAWSGAGFIATVSGDAVAVKLKSEGGSDPIFFQPVIDGMPKPRFSVSTSDGEKTVSLGTGLGAGDHVVELYRETEGKSNYAVSTFLGFTSGTLGAPPAYSGRLIEIVGDSISAGYGNLGMEEHPNGGEDPEGGCRFSTETESAYATYGALAARALNADASILAGSGWGIYSDNGGNIQNVMPNLFANTVGGQASPAWSFTAKPQAVVINLGTNDFSANMSLAESSFSTAYKGFLTTVREKYPDTLILCAIGPMLYGTGLTNATAYINALVAEVNGEGDTKVKVLNFGQQNASAGTGCDWHPNVTENQRMAGLLETELRSSLGW